MQRFTLTLDLQNDPGKIAEYERWHQRVWPEIMDSIRQSGIVAMEIYRFGNRLCMVMETESGFSFEKKAALDATNPKVQEWETLMWEFQQPVPGAAPGQKWVLMERIFQM